MSNNTPCPICSGKGYKLLDGTAITIKCGCISEKEYEDKILLRDSVLGDKEGIIKHIKDMHDLLKWTKGMQDAIKKQRDLLGKIPSHTELKDILSGLGIDPSH